MSVVNSLGGAEAAEVPEAGVILADESLRNIAMDSGSAAILCDVNDYSRYGSGSRSLLPDKLSNASALRTIPAVVAEALRGTSRDNWPSLRIHFRGRKYEYHCCLYHVEPNNFGMEPLIILYFQRDSSANNAILRVAKECGLTPREGEVLTGLSKGLTSKEIAQQLGISPNTVKTYLRLIMVKMGVTTRAAIVGRLLNHESTTNTGV